MSDVERRIAALSPDKRALLLRRLASGGARRALPELVRREDPTTYPLSFAQQRFWFLDRWEPDTTAYTMAGGVHLSGPLDAPALERAVREIARRHEGLRARFETADGLPVQRIDPEPAPLRYMRVPGADRRAREDEALRLAVLEARSPFDLGTGPLLRTTLLTLGREEHLVVVAMHHIVSDGWSIGLFIRELATLYAAFREGRPSPLPPLPIQYADYASWQRSWLADGVQDAQMDYWREQLAGMPVLALPTDRPRPDARTSRGDSVRFRLPADFWTRAQALGRAEDATPFMVTLAAWTALLGRYSAQTDIAVGTPVANRVRPETEGLIGLFANTLVIRTDLSDGPSFRELLRRTRDTSLEALQHQDVPFDRVVEALHPNRDRKYTPLFQVEFDLQNAHAERLSLPDLEIRPVELDTQAAKFDLQLSLEEDRGGLAGRIVYRTDLYDAATITRMAGHYRRLLRAAVDRPDTDVQHLPLLADEERRQMVEAWSGTPSPRALVPVHEAVTRQVARSPDAVAVVAAGESVTYADLDARANRLAHHLRRRGIGPDSVVGVCLERSVDLVVALLGVLRAGGAFLPLDPAYPSGRLAFMAEDAGIRLLLTDEAGRRRLPEPRVAVIAMDRDAASWIGEPPKAPRSAATLGSLAYVLYTSGSTGRPKGVEIEHRALANHLAWYGETFGLDAGDVLIQKTPLNFDPSVREVLAPLVVGARLILAPPGAERDPRLLLATMEREGVTLLNAVPSLLGMLLDAGGLERCRALRQVLVGGEVLAGALLRRLVAVSPAQAYNLYGPTETTIAVTWHPWQGEERVPLGRPVDNVRLYVVDPSLAPVPVGVPGELLVGGAQLARGYRNRPDLTAERFVPDPFRPGQRVYRTGDRARWRPDGTLEYLGRADDQIKIRGVRIEPGEVEAVLRALDTVRDAHVAVRDDVNGSRLVAWVLPADGVRLEEPALRTALLERLPDPMVPAAFGMVEAWPLLPNGKVDRGALPTPAGPERRSGGPAALATETQATLAAHWAELLGCASVAPADHFFDLGGHSLLAMRLQARIRRAFGIDLSIQTIFDAPTLEALAARIDAALGTGRPTPGPTIPPADRTGSLTLSSGQLRLWFLEQLEPDSPLYGIPGAVRLTGPLDLDAFRRALGQVVARHEALRTTFRERGGEAEPVIHPATSPPLPVTDLTDLEGAEQEKALRRILHEEGTAPFDLRTGPLVRARLVRLAAEQHVAAVTLHHIISDGWSIGVFVRDWLAHYDAALRGTRAELGPLPIQYVDYAAWQRTALEGEDARDRLAWWSERLRGAPALLALPTDRPRPAVRSVRGGMVAGVLSPELSGHVRALSLREGATPFMTLLATWQVLLARLSGQDDICVGTPVANRARPETEGLVGFFVNTLVVRTDLSGAPSFREVLARVKEASLGAFDHQDVPFEDVVEAVRPERHLNHTPLFQAMFVLQSTPYRLPDAAAGGLRIEPVETGSDTAKFDVTLFTTDEGGAIACRLNYSADLFEAGTAERMLTHFRVLLEAAVQNPDTPIDRLALMDAGERHQVLEVWSQGPSADYDPRPIHDILADVARAHPDQVAIRAPGEELTYRELEVRANRLAHHLRGRGVGPESVVAVGVERSADLVIAFLAVLRAGGAYLPLDPSYPDDRLHFMTEDAGAVLLLTQSALVPRLARPDLPYLALDRDGAAWEGEPEMAPEDGAGPDSLAYVLYTSGSTGRPKGVEVEHRALSNHVGWFVETFALTPDDRVVQKTPVSFDPSVHEFWAPLLAGGRLVLAPPGAEREPDLLIETLVSEGATMIGVVPTLLGMLLDAGGLERCTTLRQMWVGGEALPLDLVRRLAAVLPIPCTNLYGPTEACVDSTWHPVDPAAERVPIGRPVANTEALVLGAAVNVVPVGVPGELYVGGVQLARGYRNRPELTTERFVAHPFRPGGRLYRTGDRARWLPDGTLEFLGRLDDQVKLRGVRIEIGEVEAALRETPGVAAAVAALRDDGPTPRLVAWVAARDDARLETGALRDTLRRRLPEAMVPAAFVVLKALPTLPSGKVDRSRLPAPEAGVALEAEPPITEAEATLAAVWSAVLEVPAAGRQDNFFSLGGDSILSLQVVARAREEGFDLRVKDIFETATLAELAARATPTAEAGARRWEAVGARVYALAPIQRRFFRLAEGTDAAAGWWNQSILLRTRRPLLHDALEAAVRAVLGRHEALRLRFERDEAGSWGQRHGIETVERVLRWRDLSEVAPDRQKAAVEADASAAQQTLDLRSGPIFGVHAWSLGTEARLLVLAHHLVVDAVSWRLLLADLGRAYARAEAGETTSLSAATAPYAVWAERLASADDAARREIGYWRRVVGRGGVRLPTDAPDAPDREGDSAILDCTLKAEQTEALLRALAAIWHAAVDEAVLAAVGVAVGAWSGEREVVLEVEGHGRDEIWPDLDVSETVGWFTALFPVRLAGAGSEAGDALRRAREALASVPRGGHGWGSLREAGVSFAADRAPDVAINYLGQVERGHGEAAAAWLEAAPELPRPERDPRMPRSRPVTVVASLRDGALRMAWHYASGRFTPEAVEAAAARAIGVLRSLTAPREAARMGGADTAAFPDVDLTPDEMEALLGAVTSGDPEESSGT